MTNCHECLRSRTPVKVKLNGGVDTSFWTQTVDTNSVELELTPLALPGNHTLVVVRENTMESAQNEFLSLKYLSKSTDQGFAIF